MCIRAYRFSRTSGIRTQNVQSVVNTRARPFLCLWVTEAAPSPRHPGRLPSIVRPVRWWLQIGYSLDYMYTPPSLVISSTKHQRGPPGRGLYTSSVASFNLTQPLNVQRLRPSSSSSRAAYFLCSATCCSLGALLHARLAPLSTRSPQMRARLANIRRCR